MVRRVGAWDSHVEGLKWTLLAALGIAACSGRSVRHSSDGDDAGEPNHGATGGTGGTRGGGTPTGGKGGSAGSIDYDEGGTGDGAQGGTGAFAGAGGNGAVSGTGAVGGDAGQPSNEGGVANFGQGGLGNYEPSGCAAAAGYSGNLEQCGGGFVHRAGSYACALSPRSTSGAGGEGGGSDDGVAGSAGLGAEEGCFTDADCTERPNGYCLSLTGALGYDYPYCEYACETDGDCFEGELCSCESNFVNAGSRATIQLGTCRPATCRADSECGAGLLCVAPLAAPCDIERPTRYACQTWADECGGPEDCGSVLDYDCEQLDGTFRCDLREVCGRPFVIGNRARTAGVAERSDWSAASSRREVGLDDMTREAIARTFSNAALAEHASVAAFARFTLELLALGAPDDLVRESVCAMSDETRHAKLCFALASRYAASQVGPDALDMSGAFADSDFSSVVERAVIEGAIGETAAALEAAWAHDAATDDAVRAALSVIAEDEARHAALAFRFLAWAAERDQRVISLMEHCVREAERHATEAERCASEAEDPADSSDVTVTLRAHGVLDAKTRRAARSVTLREIIPDALAVLRKRHSHRGMGASARSGYASTHGEASRLLG